MRKSERESKNVETRTTAAHHHRPNGRGERLAGRYGIDEETLRRRREFIRLTEEDRETLMALIPWAEKVSSQIAKEFYDWQFGFGPTRAFFELHARAKGVPLSDLRTYLERAQAGYYLSVFTGAREEWGVEFYESRLHIGALHDRINLPFKWYIGAYVEYERLTRIHLEKHKIPVSSEDAESAIFKVFNYDIQAIGDSFLMSTLESMGLSIEVIDTDSGADRTEHLDQVKQSVATLLAQAKALAEKNLADPVLKERVQGALGEAFSSMVANLMQFLGSVAEQAKALSKASEDLRGLSQQMSAAAAETASQAGVVSSASEQVSRNVQTVATSTEEMGASIREIAKNANDAARIAVQGARMSEKTNETVGKLGDSSAEIGKVIKVITSIAGQTNLLALNATIEAARAGEAGKGFAVVANEVKELAKETAKATEDISQKIEAIQSDAKAAVDAIAQIGQTIKQISEIQNTIAGAVEEQSATTSDMGRNVVEAARGSQEIVKNISGVAQAAQSTASGANDTLSAARNVNETSTALQDLVRQYGM